MEDMLEAAQADDKKLWRTRVYKLKTAAQRTTKTSKHDTQKENNESKNLQRNRTQKSQPIETADQQKIKTGIAQTIARKKEKQANHNHDQRKKQSVGTR